MLEQDDNTFDDVREKVVASPNDESGVGEDDVHTAEDAAEADAAGESAEGTPQADAKPVQTEGERHANAELRRAKETAEKQLRIADQRREKAEQLQQRLLEAVQGYGYSGTPEEVAAQIYAQHHGGTAESVRQQWEAEQRAVEDRVKSDPRVVEAEQLVRTQRAAMEEQKDLASIKAMFPQESAKAMDEIANYGEFVKYRFIMDEDGNPTGLKNSAEDAYYLANREAKHRAKSNDKEHFVSPGGGTKGGLTDVPRDVLAQYKLLMPKATDREIKEHYNRSIKEV
ncbi:MAG: hypothetical protein RR009_03525 [Oscillospiraceae bacterium]